MVGNGVTFDGDYDVLLVDTVDLAYNIATGNCFTTDTMNLLIHPLPKLQLILVLKTCISFGDTNIQFSPFGGTWSGTGIDINSGLFSPLSAGIGTHKLLYSYQYPITACWNYDSLVQLILLMSITLMTLFCLDVGKQINNSTTEVKIIIRPFDGSTSGLYSPSFSIDTVGFFNINYIAEPIKAA